MKLLISILLSCICMIVAEPGWFTNLFSNIGGPSITDDMFNKALKDAKLNTANIQQKLDDEVTLYNKQLPTFETGTFGHSVTSLLDSAKKVTENYIAGVRNTASELTRSMIAATANTGIDLLLNEFKILSSATGIGSELSLPDIETSAYGCNLIATGGYFSSLSSLEKSDNIDVTILDSDSAILDIPMSFSEMRVGYNNFQVKALKVINKSGMDSTCALNVEKVTIQELDGIIVKFEGLGSYTDSITGKLSNLLINYLKNVIARYIQDAVDTNLRTALDKNSMICSNFVPT